MAFSYGFLPFGLRALQDLPNRMFLIERLVEQFPNRLLADAVLPHAPHGDGDRGGGRADRERGEVRGEHVPDDGERITSRERARDLDERRRSLIGETETLKQQRNSASKEIGAAAKAGQDISAAKEKVRAIGDRIAEIDRELAQVEIDLRETLLMIPNIPAPEIPTGLDSSSNKVVRHVGEWKDPAYPIPDHTQIGERLGIFDFPRGVKLTGTGFPIILGQGAKLQRALIQYMLDLHCQKQGYTEMLPPFLVNSASMTGTGQLPKFAEDLYHSNADDFWLIVRRRETPEDHTREPRQAHSLHALLPPRGRKRRQDDARHAPRPPVRQGRDGQLRPPLHLVPAT